MRKQRRIVLRGFTLIELLIVMAILGVLAGATLIAINPVEQINRAKDSSRKESIVQLGRAVQSYQSINSTVPVIPANYQWMTVLQQSGEIKSIPDNNNADSSYQVTCSASGNGPYVANHNKFCYATSADGQNAVIYAPLQALLDNNKCKALDSTKPNAWYVWDSVDGKSGVYCAANSTYPPVNQSLPLL